MRNSDFFCVNIHVAEKAVWKKPFGKKLLVDLIEIMFVPKNGLCLDQLDIVSVSTYIVWTDEFNVSRLIAL
jgi:hypothetical protein